jgi:carbon-monoxide dehydrogenase large subunit
MVVDLADAIRTGAPLVWPEATGNYCLQHRHGNAEAATLAMAAASASRSTLDLVNQRLAPRRSSPARTLRQLRRPRPNASRCA